MVWTPLKASMLSDNLTDTVDYVILNKIIKEEMEKRSKLLENVCSRILNRLFFEQKNILKAKIEVAKQNPPIGGDVESVSIILKRSNISK